MRFFLFVSIFIPIYTLYLKTMPPTVFWQDSGIFLSGIKEFGIIFPPGFPLYILLGTLWTKIFSLLPIAHLNFTQQVHAFSGLWGAGAAALAGLSVYELIHEKNTIRHPEFISGSTTKRMLKQVQHDTKDVVLLLISIISGLSTGFSYSLWSQSINAEAYSMIGFFAALLLFLVVKLIKIRANPPLGEQEFLSLRKRYQKYLLFLAVIWGLSFSVHLLTITFALPLLFLLFYLRLFPFFQVLIENRKTYQPILDGKAWVRILLVFFLSAFLPYLYLPLRSMADPIVLWAKIDSPRAFLEHITGEAYRTSENAIGSPTFQKIKSYPVLFFQEFFLLGGIFGLLGWATLFSQRKNYRYFALFGLIYAAFFYLLISFYERGTEYNFWLIPFYLYWSILSGLGFWWTAEKFKNNMFRTFVIMILTLGVLAPPLWVNWPILNRSNYFLAEEFGKNLIGQLPQDAIFFTMGDQESSIPSYLQLVQGVRRDVLAIADSDLAFGWRRQRLAKFHPYLIVPQLEKREDLSPEETGRAINEFILANLPKRNIFVITKNYLPLWPEFKLVPAGTIWQIRQIDDPEIVDLHFWQYQFSDPNRYQRPERSELSKKKTNYINGRQVVTYERAPYFEEAKVFELQAKKNLGDLCFGAFKEKRAVQVKNLSGQLEAWQGEKLTQCAISSYEEMFKIDPKFYHREVFLNLADLYQKAGQEEEVKRLIERVERE